MGGIQTSLLLGFSLGSFNNSVTILNTHGAGIAFAILTTEGEHKEYPVGRDGGVNRRQPVETSETTEKKNRN